MTQNKCALAVHGGAGTIIRSLMTSEMEREYRSGLENALKTGWKILQKGGSSLDAVEAAVIALEDFPLFNAGYGSVFTHEGKNELDASIMDGKTLRAGAVAFVKNVKNPIKLARLVMESSEHVLLAGEGANQFAEQMGVETAPDEYFFTQHRYDQLVEAIEAGRIQLDHHEETRKAAETRPSGSVPSTDGSSSQGISEKSVTTKQHEKTRKAAETRPLGSVPSSKNRKSKIQNRKSFGTVGAVACDINGDLAAATSTGGMTNKQFGRVGDTPLIGSGTYAENSTCAVSCTGHGEYFMLGVTAYDVAARMKYKGLSLAEAAEEAIEYQTKIGGEGGLIAVDAQGNVTLPFNSEGMYRGYIEAVGLPMIEIYR